jgi:hypothetical protein
MSPYYTRSRSDHTPPCPASFVAAPACTPAFGLSRLILLVGLSSSNLLLLPFLSLSPTKPLPFKYPNEPPY